MRVLAIDQGTSATKAVVFDDAHGIQAEVDVPLSGLHIADDVVEQDPESLWNSIVDAGRRAMTTAAGAVDCVGVGNQGETVLAWHRSTGEPVTAALGWQDRRARATTEVMKSHAGALRRISGLPLDPYFAAPKMAWLREYLLTAEQRDDPHIVTTTVDAWVLFRLCGAFVTDAATASRTMLLDINNVSWSSTAAELFGLDVASFPEIVACDQTVGMTDVFGSSTPVTATVVDQQAALFAQRCIDLGEAKCTYGTGAFLLANLGHTARLSEHGLATSVAWQLCDDRPVYCIDGQVYTAGAAIAWLRRLGLIADAADIDTIGLSVATADGVHFVPSLAGIGAPVWDAAARGSFTGLSLSTTTAHLVRAVGEGIAAQVALLVRSIEADVGHRLSSLRVDGGITRSRLIMQSQADLLGIPVEVYPHECATALGVGAMALRGRFGPGAETAILDGWQPRKVYQPRLPSHEAADWLASWQSLLHSTLTAASGS